MTKSGNCSKIEPVSWRTPNEWWFVAVCQRCGKVAVSVSDGGTAAKALHTLHGTVNPSAAERERTRETYE